MRPIVVLLLVGCAKVSVAQSSGAVAPDDIFRWLNPIFSPGVLAPSTNATWWFKSRTDNSRARLVVDAEGIHDGAPPDGYAEVAGRAQDEIRDPYATGSVIASSDMWGGFRVFSHSYKWSRYPPYDPRVVQCEGVECGRSTVFYSLGAWRGVAYNGEPIDFITNNRSRFQLWGDGHVVFPDLGFLDDGANRWVCMRPSGAIYSQATPCR